MIQLSQEEQDLFAKGREQAGRLRRAGALGAPRSTRSREQWAAIYGATRDDPSPEGRAHNRAIMRAVFEAGELRPWCEAHGVRFWQAFTMLLAEAGHEVEAGDA